MVKCKLLCAKRCEIHISFLIQVKAELGECVAVTARMYILNAYKCVSHSERKVN